MLHKRLLNVVQLSVVGFGGYHIGQNKDKYCDYFYGNSVTIDGKRIINKPGLPVFGTVSAATPFVETGGPKDRVRICC